MAGNASSFSFQFPEMEASASPLESVPPEILNLILDALVLARCHTADGCCRNACPGCRTPWVSCAGPHGPLAQSQCGVRELKSLLLASTSLSRAVRSLPSFQALLLSVSIAAHSNVKYKGTIGPLIGDQHLRGEEGAGARGPLPGHKCQRGEEGVIGIMGYPASCRSSTRGATDCINSSVCTLGHRRTSPGPSGPETGQQWLQGTPVEASQDEKHCTTAATVFSDSTVGHWRTSGVGAGQQGLQGTPVEASECREDPRQWVRSLYLRELRDSPREFGISGVFGALGPSHTQPQQAFRGVSTLTFLRHHCTDGQGAECHCTERQNRGCHCTPVQGTGCHCALHRPSLGCADRGAAHSACHCTDRVAPSTEGRCTGSTVTERHCIESTSTERHCAAEVQPCSTCGHWVCPELQQYSSVVVLHLPHWFNDRLSHSLGDLRSLRTLCLRGCAVGDATLARLATVGGINELDLSSTGVTTGGLFHLRKLRFLRILNLSFCRDICAQSGVPLQGLRALEELYLCGTVVSDDTMGLISNLPKLRRIDLEGCESISDAGLDVIGRLLARNRIRTEALCHRSQWGRSFMEVLGMSYLE